MGPGNAGRPRLTADVAVVGGGAAGLMAGIFIRRFSPQLEVAVLDGAARPGAKILVSGGSRCNVTNRVVTERDFNGGRPAIVRRVLRAFPVADTIAFFTAAGVALHEEPYGKLFPDSNRSRDVLDALLGQLAAAGGRLLPSTRVASITRRDEGFELETTSGLLHAGRVVLATGGLALPRSGSDGAGLEFARALGHTIVPLTPALVPLLLADRADGAPSLHAALSGVAHDVDLTLHVGGAVARRVRGPMLWTHFGISGPAALDLSRHWLRARLEGANADTTLNFLPGETFESIDGWLSRGAMERPRSSVEALVAGRLPASVARALLASAAADGSTALAHLSRPDRRTLTHALHAWPLAITGSRGYTHAEVTAGGVALDEIDPASMQSRRCPGLYLVGEILDVDGRLGGFNFQWAWASGYQCGRGMARSP